MIQKEKDDEKKSLTTAFMYALTEAHALYEEFQTNLTINYLHTYDVDILSPHQDIFDTIFFTETVR
ncbi:hypothetical protein ABID39_001189 [Bartonella japonica]|uniref:Uncharacterized protein n=1 Tax=Bartonella japonica TaxID=357761 RepID=A0ABV2FPM6_9HYPH